ncbi:Ig-like domain-containing protein [Pantoea agglomerans]
MKAPLNLLVVDGKKVIHSATLPTRASGEPVHIQAIDSGKYLLSSGENQPAPDHVVVKRVGNDLQMFTQDGDNTPKLIIDDFYQHKGELSGLAPDGSYHVYVNQDGHDRDAFLLLDDNGSSTLILGDTTRGLEGLVVSDALSNAALGLAALAALAGTGIALMHHHHHDSDNTPPISAPAPDPVPDPDPVPAPDPTPNPTPDPLPVPVPPPGIAHDRVGTLQGIIPEHGLTNDNHPLLTGVAAKGSMLRVYADGQLIGSTLVGADGTWQLVPDAPLADGSHDLTFSAAYGNRESAQSSPINFVVDTTPPDAPLVDIVDGKDQDLTQGGLTNNGDIALSGHDGVPGDVVELFDGDKQIGSSVVGADGSWSVPITLMGDGEHNLSASYTDPAGNTGPRSPLAPVDLDTTAPTTTLVLDDNAPSLSGVTEANALVFIYDGTTLLASQKADANGDWSWKPGGTLPDGLYHYNATAQDALGNTSAHTANLDFKVATRVNDFNDTTGQGWAIAATHSADTSFTGANVRIHGSGALASGELMYREITVQAGHTYNFSFTTLLTTLITMPPTILKVGLTLNGTELGAPTDLYYNTAHYSWTATTSGVVRIALVTDDTLFPAGNNGYLDNFTIRDSAPVGPTSVSSFTGQNHDDSLIQHDDSISSLSAAHPDSHVTQQHQGEDIHSLSLAGHGNNVLNVNISDVLALGSDDLFQQDGHKQLMIKGDAGDTVNLASLNGDKSPEQWNAQGQVSHDGTTFNVYQSVDHQVEVLIQQGIQTHVQ